MVLITMATLTLTPDSFWSSQECQQAYDITHNAMRAGGEVLTDRESQNVCVRVYVCMCERVCV